METQPACNNLTNFNKLSEREAMPSTLAQKLNLKPGIPLEAANVPEEWLEQLGKELPVNPINFFIREKPAAILVFIKNKEQLEKLAFPIIPILPAECLFWMAYPKSTSGIKTDINRDILWKLVEPTGWEPVRMIALDEIWSCMRFRPVIAKK
jgi:hypothetical protein